MHELQNNHDNLYQQTIHIALSLDLGPTDGLPAFSKWLHAFELWNHAKKNDCMNLFFLPCPL